MLIVNLTTINTRLDLCAATLWSLIHQEVLPDYIYLWVSSEPYLSDEGMNFIPEFIHELNEIHNIIKVVYTENTGPYRKIIPALRSFSNDDILVYADDDVIYSRFWLKKMMDKFNFYDGGCIVAPRVRLMSKNLFGHLKSYSEFDVLDKEKVLSDGYIITGVGGCLLKKGHVNESLYRLDDYLNLAPKTDDLWLSKIFQLSQAKLVCAPEIMGDIHEIKHARFALTNENTIFNNGSGFFKIFYKIKTKISGYLGLENTNNDLSLIKIKDFFSSYKRM